MRLFRLVAAAAVLLAATTAHAQRRAAADPAYANVKVGFWAPNGTDLDGFDTGLGLGVTFGRRIDRNLAMEFGVAWYGTKTGTFVDEDPDFGTVFSSTSLQILPVTGALKLVFPGSVAEPYLEGGVGLYFSRMTADTTFPGFGTSEETDSAASIGAHVGLGTTIALTPHASLLFEARYHAARAELFGLRGRIDGLAVNGGMSFAF